MKNLLEKLGITGTAPGTFAEGWLPKNSKRSSQKSPFEVRSPIDRKTLAEVVPADDETYAAVLEVASNNFLRWRVHPAPRRGELVRQCAEVLRSHKTELGELVSLEVGKIRAEGEGEIQEMIDIADFAVGLSRQLEGANMPSERESHRLVEQWHPLGNVGVITAFNFPAAVWAWNAMIGAVCGNSIIWKPSPLAPLTAIAVTSLCARVAEQHGFPGLFSLLCTSGNELSERLVRDPQVALVSATGSTRMGRDVGCAVAGRLGRSLLELGGNNGVIVLEDADMKLALRAVLFGAVGTAGQRCTTTRRLILQKSIAKDFVQQLINAYKKIRIGNPLDAGVLMGPLISEAAVEQYRKAIERIKKEGGEILYGGRVLEGHPSVLYVEPTIVRATKTLPIMAEETFAPILYVVTVDDLEEAIAVNNGVAQGLSSAIFTRDLRSAEFFLSARGSDCGLANVNCGTSGAEIGGAFGGEKDTGGGRESGSDAWKAYMRRQTAVINYGTELPLAQGVTFE